MFLKQLVLAQSLKKMTSPLQLGLNKDQVWLVKLNFVNEGGVSSYFLNKWEKMFPWWSAEHKIHFFKQAGGKNNNKELNQSFHVQTQISNQQKKNLIKSQWGQKYEILKLQISYYCMKEIHR